MFFPTHLLVVGPEIAYSSVFHTDRSVPALHSPSGVGQCSNLDQRALESGLPRTI